MPHGTKIATCCYCGSRTVLKLTGKVQHELSCSACGAPLHDLKMLKKDAVSERPVTTKRKAAVPVPSSPVWERKAKPTKRKKKKKKSLTRKMFSEVWDVIEDIID